VIDVFSRETHSNIAEVQASRKHKAVLAVVELLRRIGSVRIALEY
jgi:hypothetical protein